MQEQGQQGRLLGLPAHTQSDSCEEDQLVLLSFPYPWLHPGPNEEGYNFQCFSLPKISRHASERRQGET